MAGLFGRGSVGHRRIVNPVAQGGGFAPMIGGLGLLLAPGPKRGLQS